MNPLAIGGSGRFARGLSLLPRQALFGAYPIDRLEEMAAEGVIGSVAPRHASFIGSTFELSTFLLDTGPRLAAELRGDGVDIALLTPV